MRACVLTQKSEEVPTSSASLLATPMVLVHMCSSRSTPILHRVQSCMAAHDEVPWPPQFKIGFYSAALVFLDANVVVFG